MNRLILTVTMLIGSTLVLTGCASAPTARAQNMQPMAPIFVQGSNEQVIWERAVDVLHEYPFRIKRENKIAGVIETEYKVGSGLCEPWHKESVGFDERLESSLQSIRRKVVLNLRRVEGGYFVDVEAFKEQEDLPGLAANSAGGATFLEHSPLKRDYNLVVGQSAPSQWIPIGRDLALEQDLSNRLRAAYNY